MSSQENTTQAPESLGLGIAVEGEGIAPSDLTIQHLAELLEATAAVLNSLDSDRTQRARPYLRKIREGSAELVFESAELEWAGLVNDFYDVVKARGAGAKAAVKRSLIRLFKAGRIGGIRVSVIGSHEEARAQPIRMAAPVEEREATIEWTSTVYGRVVGVNIFADHSTVKMELADGGRQDYTVEVSLAEKAARLFNKPARGGLYYVTSGERHESTGLTDIEFWRESDFLDDLRVIRRELEEAGMQVNPEEWIRELD
ncbi:MAG TPA: hypothetical protein DFS52_00120 [Myxococcales bacterium]|jgi:hypothetical protein|nr:hypothetical protein [Myxococcales bacterium]